ncbi:MAG TPA: exonuclease domain-containing protein [Chloroflexota bacterium]|nr:exonuclease domain-containing protein [Chloroflexota bacterium]
MAPSLDGVSPEFIAIDVETANASLSSICQIGLVAFENNAPAVRWKTLINPEDYFDEVNVSIHGITKRMVRGAPTFPAIVEDVHKWLSGRVAVCHTAFDRTAIGRVAEKYGLSPVECTWLDSARVARRTWPDCSQRGYGLLDLASRLDINFCPHDAQEDAEAAGMILVRAMAETGMGMAEWMERVKKPIDPTRPSSGPIHLDGNPEGEFYGEVLVFTGALSLPRVEAAKLAAQAGCHVDDGVTKHTTLLVVGDQDLTKLAGHEKSSKHRKAESLIAKGQPIRILAESDFRLLVGMS